MHVPDRLPLGPRCDMEAHHRHSLQGCGRSYSTVPPLRFSHRPSFVWTPSGWKVHPSAPEPAILRMLIGRDGHAATYLDLKLGVLVTALFALVDSTSLDTLILEHGSLQCPYITFLTSVRLLCRLPPVPEDRRRWPLPLSAAALQGSAQPAFVLAKPHPPSLPSLLVVGRGEPGAPLPSDVDSSRHTRPQVAGSRLELLGSQHFELGLKCGPFAFHGDLTLPIQFEGENSNSRHPLNTVFTSVVAGDPLSLCFGFLASGATQLLNLVKLRRFPRQSCVLRTVSMVSSMSRPSGPCLRSNSEVTESAVWP
uniref:Uncharacterized protein n=1 Tax=Ananas comosus var. bracteatus TaxID=296719 RepID=A0A6V7P5P2_ANACO|nr:unnamed protein product [Ananas comosus var. bracteatus]